jgi:cytochrome bd-type quinol oxidase subunit 1
MNYPVWYRPGMGGGLIIACIAIIHVFIAHFAVGGGLYLVFAERKGRRENRRDILAFTRSHARFFLLMTLVAGGMTGVAIWFVISLVQPAATSLLIHVFVFGWATEWIFFLVEIVAIFVYFNAFDRMDGRTHLAVGGIYFAAAWLSLFLINGILDFMLDPGAWLADGSFWSGFFNPLFWPSLAFRTAVACLLAGVYAFLTTAS